MEAGSSQQAAVSTQQTPDAAQNEDALLPLDAPRVVNFRDRGNPFTWHFRRLTDDDWRNYFAAGVVESERSGTALINRIDFASAGVALVENALTTVDGYLMRQGELMALPKWKQRLPLGHRQLALNLLQQVDVNQQDRELVFDADVEEVRLDAMWEIVPKPDGANTMYRGLVHRLRLPSAEEQRKYFRATSESRVVGGSRTGRTIYANRRGILLELYDELVVEVEGYSVAGEPLTGRFEAIRKHMDGCHKMLAAAQLFVVPEYEGPES